MKHSSLPWEVVKYTDTWGEEVWEVRDANYEIVFSCNWVPYEGGGIQPSDEDAEFILWAVNIYAERMESFDGA